MSNRLATRRGMVPKPAVCISKRRKPRLGSILPPPQITIGLDEWTGFPPVPFVIANLDVLLPFGIGNAYFAGGANAGIWRIAVNVHFQTTDGTWSGFYSLADIVGPMGVIKQINLNHTPPLIDGSVGSLISAVTNPYSPGDWLTFGFFYPA